MDRVRYLLVFGSYTYRAQEPLGDCGIKHKQLTPSERDHRLRSTYMYIYIYYQPVYCKDVSHSKPLMVLVALGKMLQQG